MATTCPIGFDIAGLRAQVLATYERVARDPSGDFHFCGIPGMVKAPRPVRRK
jgi:hypothetical protein